MAEMLNALSFFDHDVNSPLRSLTLSPKHSKRYHIPKTGNETNPASTLGIILDPHHTFDCGRFSYTPQWDRWFAETANNLKNQEKFGL